MATPHVHRLQLKMREFSHIMQKVIQLKVYIFCMWNKAKRIDNADGCKALKNAFLKVEQLEIKKEKSLEKLIDKDFEWRPFSYNAYDWNRLTRAAYFFNYTNKQISHFNSLNKLIIKAHNTQLQNLKKIKQKYHYTRSEWQSLVDYASSQQKQDFPVNVPMH